MFFKPRRTNFIGGMLLGVAVGLSVMGGVCVSQNKNLCKKLKKDVANMGCMVKQSIDKMF